MINISNFTYHATEGIIDLENNFIFLPRVNYESTGRKKTPRPELLESSLNYKLAICASIQSLSFCFLLEIIAKERRRTRYI